MIVKFSTEKQLSQCSSCGCFNRDTKHGVAKKIHRMGIRYDNGFCAYEFCLCNDCLKSLHQSISEFISADSNQNNNTD